MIRRLLQIRILVIIIILFILLNAMVFIGMGCYLSIKGIIHIFEGKIGGDHGANPAFEVLESVDLFLVALVFIILAYGVAELFLPKQFSKVSDLIPEWLKVNSFSELKVLLWEAILLALVVLFVGNVIRSAMEMSWEMIILPVSILILSVSVWVIKKGGH